MNTNLNIRTDKDVKEQADKIFAELGLNMTTAINMFLRTAIRVKGIPFEIKLEVPNDETKKAIEVGREITKDKNIKGYKSIDELKEALEK